MFAEEVVFLCSVFNDFKKVVTQSVVVTSVISARICCPEVRE